MRRKTTGLWGLLRHRMDALAGNTLIVSQISGCVRITGGLAKVHRALPSEFLVQEVQRGEPGGGGVLRMCCSNKSPGEAGI